MLTSLFSTYSTLKSLPDPSGSFAYVAALNEDPSMKNGLDLPYGVIYSINIKLPQAICVV